MRAVVPVLAVLAFATAALADPPPGTIMKVTPPAAGPATLDVAKICVMQFQHSVELLGVLEKALVLNEKQKPLFDTWKKTRIATMHGWPCPRPATGVDVPTPTRLDREETLLAYEVDSLRKEKPLIAALYEALSPEQRATFDRPPTATPAPAPAAGQPRPAASH